MKLLSHDPDRYEDAATAGINRILDSEPDSRPIGARIDSVKMGTTVATNALLEYKGAATALAVTEGFGDLCLLGYQNREDIFALQIKKAKPLYKEVIELEERLSADGTIITPLNEVKTRAALKDCLTRGVRSLAVVCLHGYAFSKHELRIGEIARELGFEHVSLSHLVSPLIKVVARGETTVADAYLSPVLKAYVDQVAEKLPGVDLRFMQSNGGLVEAARFRGKDAVLSGPAGGIIGAVETCREAGFEQIVSFDMGGTSTDVAHYSGELERTYDRAVGGFKFFAPSLLIHTVAAGGGSIIGFDGARFQIGPDSAGARPGPACYGQGGPATVTDCNLLLGRLVPAQFPKVFGKDGRQSLDPKASESAFAAVCGSKTVDLNLVEGCLEIAVNNMAEAVKAISVSRGFDLKDYTLCGFGGAAGQTACKVADRLDVKKVFIHPLAGVLSALGIGLADSREQRTLSVSGLLTAENLKIWSTRLDKESEKALAALGEGPYEAVAEHRHVHLRYQGTDQALRVPLGDLKTMKAAFTDAYRRRFGFVQEEIAIEAAAVEVEAVGKSSRIHLNEPEPTHNDHNDQPIGETKLYSHGRFYQAGIYEWSRLNHKSRIQGPALIINKLTTVVVDPGWCATIKNGLVLEKTGETPRKRRLLDRDPIQLEIFNHAYRSIAEQMGYTLQNAASSVNIKERLDFSCAVFDGQGRLIANAPHMPVHLGSMGETVRALIRAEQGQFLPGLAFAANNPYDGGTHLPDITVINPVFIEGYEKPLFFTASRGHHADIGGITPGSMPAFSQTIHEEGAFFDNQRLVMNGRFQEAEVRRILAHGPYPARNPDRNIADLKAQLAANEKGARELEKLVARHGADMVTAYMKHIRDYAEERVREVLSRLNSGSFRYAMDNGLEVQVRVTINSETRAAQIDFNGSSQPHKGNFNAPAAVCKAAVLYAFRCLVEEDIPLNEGCVAPLHITLPSPSFLNPTFPAAVVAGNVETSQVVTDALFGALGVLAGAQGTMNNLTFGNDNHQYYETICGGSGAGSHFDGTDAVQTHMTNSRITDPEILETRFPVRLECFSVRRNSGGAGRHKGGNGATRRFLFLEDMDVAILANRGSVPPFGLAGGEPGKTGKRTLIREDGIRESLDTTAQVQVRAGDRLQIETPGGGGFGKS